MAGVPARHSPAGRPVAALRASSRFAYKLFPMSKNVGSNAKPKLGKAFEPSKLNHTFCNQMAGAKKIWLNLA
jgi:hypothetical protein